MVDMTRVMSDHNFIISEYKRLSEKFPNRVILKNNFEQYEKLTSKIQKNGVDWGAFYKIFEELEDHDVVIKCDDDILFIDIERLESALELRYLNQQPLIMHSNCINNGVCAFHQYKQGAWRFDSELLAMYPSAGLSGPIFIDHGDVADKMHTQFVNDLNQNFNNINKYKLKENLYLLQRISINFTFFLGKDREILKTISEQDEYLVSCKIPQLKDRPNMIIADMITSHYSYGAQKKLRDNQGIQKYKTLAADYLKLPLRKKSINNKFGKVITIKKNKTDYLFAPPEKEKFAIKNSSKKKYLSFKFNKTEKVIYENKDDPSSIKHTGTFFLGNQLYTSDKPEALFQFKNGVISNQSEILKAHANPNSNQYVVFPINKFYNHAHLDNKFFTSKNKGGHVQDKDGKYLICDRPEGGDPVFYFQKIEKKYVNEDAHIWMLEEVATNSPLLMRIHREDVSSFENDSTYATSLDPKKQDMKNARGYYWTIKNHLWEIEEKPYSFFSLIGIKNKLYSIKVINDEENDRYLCEKEGELCLSFEKFYWKIENSSIQNPKTKKYIHIGQSIELLENYHALELSI